MLECEEQYVDLPEQDKHLINSKTRVPQSRKNIEELRTTRIRCQALLCLPPPPLPLLLVSVYVSECVHVCKCVCKCEWTAEMNLRYLPR